jgi:phospho-N-acetylmuramoyl-pentapeptide-transferase
MLYYLSQTGSFLHGTSVAKALNVFQYISFRALCAGLTSFLLCLVFGNLVIRRLVSLKLGQPIRTAEEVHRLNELHGGKKGTPTMGGILLIGAVIVSTLLWARPDNPFVWTCLVTVFSLGALGFYDDWLKVVRKNSDGISSRLKFLLQCFLALGITAFFLLTPSVSRQAQEFYIPFVKGPVLTHLGWWIFLPYLFIIVGTSNAVNLTDGLDGLAAGCTVMAGACFGVFTYLAGNSKTAFYLQIPYHPFSGELAVVSLALAGASLGFLWWNCHPAKVFMGDTGSLAIGGLLGILAICCKQELLLAIVGGVFVAEALSVILQVASFKLTGKRIFKMSPLHHHFELSGWKENTVTVRFWIMAIVFGLLGIATLKLR